MAKLATNPNDVIEAITQFASKVEGSEGLQERLAYARAWYAVRDIDDNWVFGPSKFIGYKGLTANEYLHPRNTLDGRKTEAHIAQWFNEVGEKSPLHEELWDKLADFLSVYGKEPSRKARINVLNEDRDKHIADLDGGDHHAKIVSLILEVTRGLPSTHLNELKKRLKA